MKDNSALTAGTILNDSYYIHEILGRGGFGITYKAFDQKKQCIVAIKEFFPRKMAFRNIDNGMNVQIISGYETLYEQQQKKYMREAGVLLELYDLPGIVHVNNFFYANNTAYMAMDYIEGISLESYLKQQGGCISWQQTLNIMNPLLQSLEAVHKRHILHRDISPDNILLTTQGEIVLVDFGAAGTYMEEGDDSETNLYVKYGYAAKEQFIAGAPQGNYTDIHALCVTMYRMMTGLKPPSAKDRQNGQGKIKPLNRMRVIEKVPRHIEKAIMKGLALNGEDRQQSVGELYQQLYSTEEERINHRLQKTQNAMITATLAALIVFVIIGLVVVQFKIVKNRQRTETERPETSETVLYGSGNDNQKAEEQDSGSRRMTENSDNHNTDAQTSGTGQEDSALQGMENQSSANITVVKKGILNGYDGNLTMETIFTQYYEDGVWQEPESGKVIYIGKKNNDYYAFFFTVQDGETYELNDIARNGSSVGDMNSFFNNMIYELGY